MSAEPDDLDKLLSDVRKTIKDNQQFLQGLVDETVAAGTDPESGEENSEREDGEAFEEL
ncbi:MAG: hypothetical protein WC156_12385 [Pedobacter sp.]